MKKFWFAFSLIILSLLCLLPNQGRVLANAEEEIKEEIVYLTNSPNSHYYQIGEVASFALSGDELYYTNASHELLSYTLSSNTAKRHEIFDVTMLRPKSNSIFYISNGILYTFDGEKASSIGQASIFDYYEDETTNTLCYLHENILTIASYNKEGILQPTEVYDFNIHTTINYKDIKAITATEKGCILILEHVRPSSINIEFYYLIPDADITIIHNTISDTYYDCSMIKYSKIDDQQVLALLYQSNIAVIKIDDNLNWEKTDILLQSSNNTIYAPTYINFINNSLLASDKIKKDIKSFEIHDLEDSSNMTSTTLLGSSGSSIDQYQDVRNILVKDDNDLILNDAGNHRLKRITNGATEVTDLFAYQSTDEEIKQIEVDYFNQTVILYVDHSTNHSYLRFYKDRELQYAIHSLTFSGLVQSFMVDNHNTVYYTKEDGVYSAQEKIIDLSLTHSKLYLSKNANQLILLDGQNAYAIDTQNHSYQTLSSNLGAYTSAVMDYFNNLYLLNGNEITKYLFHDNTFVITTTAHLQKEYTIMRLNQVNGKFYLYDETNACICTYYNQNFSSGMERYEDSDLSTLEDRTSLVTLAHFTENTVWITKFPNHIGITNSLTPRVMDNGKKLAVAILDRVEEYAHIAYFDESQKLVEGYVPLYYLKEKTISLNEEKSYYVISKSANTYALPAHNANLLTPLTKNEEVVVLSYAISDMNATDFEFFAIKKDDKIMYVLASDLLPITIHEPTNNTLQNASIKAKDNVKVYLTADSESIVLATLTPGTRIYAYDYNEDTTWTKIKYLNSNHEEVEGYILTSTISPDNPSLLIILCVVLSITAGVILIVILCNVVKIKQKFNK